MTTLCPTPEIAPKPGFSGAARQHIYNLGALSYGHLVVLHHALNALMRVVPQEEDCLTLKDSQSGIYADDRLDLIRRLEELGDWHMTHIAQPG